MSSDLKTVWRYEIPLSGHTTLQVPRGRTLAVAVVEPGDRIEFWLETGRPLVFKTFAVSGTSRPIPVQAQWLGTAPRTSDGLVWHLYDVTEATHG